MTIQLPRSRAVGALVIGTIVAVMRVSPVAVLRVLGASYVNVFRNTPLTLIMVFSVLGLTYIMRLNLPTRSRRPHQQNAFRWAVVGLSVYHAAFVCEALRIRRQHGARPARPRQPARSG